MIPAEELRWLPGVDELPTAPRQHQRLDTGALVPWGVCLWADVDHHLAQRTSWVPLGKAPKPVPWRATAKGLRLSGGGESLRTEYDVE